jgi:hypothetical protein
MNTVAVLYCDQPDMLLRQAEAWLDYPMDLEVLVVDAASSTPASKVLKGLCARRFARVVRLDSTEPWNIGAARNKAFASAGGAAVAVMDCDQVLSAEAADALAVEGCVEPGTFLLPYLRGALTGAPEGRHRHALLALREDFLSTGGYDERHHGYESDHLFVPRRDACLRLAAGEWFWAWHHHDGGCTRWPRTGRHNMRTRDPRGFREAMRGRSV